MKTNNKKVDFERLIKEVLNHKKEMERSAADAVPHFRRAA